LSRSCSSLAAISPTSARWAIGTSSIARRSSAFRADAERTWMNPSRCAVACSFARATSCSSFATTAAVLGSVSGCARLNSSARVPISIFLRDCALIRHSFSAQAGGWPVTAGILVMVRECMEDRGAPGRVAVGRGQRIGHASRCTWWDGGGASRTSGRAWRASGGG
jgi:hypothetical protein